MNRVYAILNALLIVGVIYWNYWVNTGQLNGKTVGGLSAEYANLFTPSSYAFAIWGFIFIGLIALAIYELIQAFSNQSSSQKMGHFGPWLLIANLGNIQWLWLWLFEFTGLSVLCMIMILVSLIMATIKLDLNTTKVSLGQKWFESIPIELYFGWISIATIANFSAWLAKLDWSFMFNEIQWTLIMISIGGLLNIIMLFYRNMRVFVLVGIWAFVAIGVRHNTEIEIIYWTAYSWAFILAVLVVFHIARELKINSLSLK